MIGRRGPGLVGMMARTAVVAGTATAVSGSVSRRQQQKAQQQQAPAPAAVSTDDQIAQLQELAKLKDSGVLTQAEFDAKKQQILGL